MIDLVKFRLPAPFVLERVLLTAGEVAHGFLQGWFLAEDVVAVSRAKLERGLSMTAIEKHLAMLPETGWWEVPDLIDKLDKSDGVLHDRSSVWLFLALDFLYTHRRDFADPLQVIEMIYADFGYPDEIEGLVRFMPAPAGVAVGNNAIEDRWHAFLESKRAYFRARKSFDS